MFFMEVGKSRQWVLCLGYRTCALSLLVLIVIVYVAGKPLLMLRNETITLENVLIMYFFKCVSKNISLEL